jgi:hypothetical protein
MRRASRTVALACLAVCTVMLAASRRGSAQSPRDSRRVEPTRRGHVETSMFAPSSDCLACHNNLIGPAGEDLSIGASWRGSMMAHSARDPYVRASVRRETIDHGARAQDIEDECATCHLPAAQKIAQAVGETATIFSHLTSAAGAGTALDELARDGVTCTVCHQIAPERLGERTSFNGGFVVAAPVADGKRRAFGSVNPDAGRRRIMHSMTGFEQEQATHIRQSELCATCHTLITEAIGVDGQVIGSLPEQMNYQEWRHSAFFQEKRSCQSCHMPLAQGPVRIASVLGEYRESLSRHTFLGGNAFMLRLLNRYRAEVALQATSAELETTARATITQLENDTARIAIERAVIEDGTLATDVVVTNLAGHKFPTGYPSRRAWIHLTVRDSDGRTLFESGRVTQTGLIEGNDNDANAETFEPHYAQITRPDEVQIYESIIGTPAGRPTTGLLEATQYLKDNRLLPRAFDKRTAEPEIRVIGDAAKDDDFAGDGDRVRYRISFRHGLTGPATIDVELRYQPIGYRWAQNLRSYDAPEPRSFVNQYESVAAFSSHVISRVSRSVGP